MKLASSDISKLDKAKIKEIYQSCSESVEYFALFFFPHLLNKKVAQFHSEIYLNLPDGSFLAIAAPRGHAKSTIVSIIYSMWFALFKQMGNITILSASESFVINEICRVIKREFEGNEKLRLFFGDMKTDKWSETYFVLKNGIAFEGGGIGGQLRGGRRGLIVLDDLESNESVESEEQRDKLKKRIHKELIPKLLPGGQIVYIGTIIHSLCYLKQVLDVPGNGWEKMFFRAYVDEKQEKGHELWSEMLPHEELQTRKRLMGSNAFQAEYMNNPVSDETAPIKENQIRYWTELPSQLSVVLSVDPAYSEDLTSDYKVCVAVGVDPQMNRYLLTYLRTHQPTGEFIDGILNLYGQYKGMITGLGVPSAGTEKEFYKSVVNKATERKIYPPFIELKNTFITANGEAKRSKKSRTIAALQPLFEAGKYYISPSHVEAREELLTIGSARWDDLVDAMAYAEQIITPTFYERPSEDSFSQAPAMAGRSANYGMED